jgi:hypothetical protein
MDGIIADLTRVYRGNVSTKGIVSITASSRSEYAFQVADLWSDVQCESDDAPGQWLCWDFGDLLLRLDGYSLASSYEDPARNRG